MIEKRNECAARESNRLRIAGVGAIVLLLGLALSVHSAWAQGHVAFGGSSSASLTASSVCPPNGGVCSATLTARIGLRIPFAMTLSSLYAFQATAPTSGSSCSFIVRTSAGCTTAYASTSLSCSITPSTNLTCSNTTATVNVNAGDCVQIQFVEVGTCSGYVTFGLAGSY
jgi:hypothetical protein